MSQCVNKVILIGFLGGAPELRFTPQGKPGGTFSVAVNESWKDAQGTRRKKWNGFASFASDAWRRSAANIWARVAVST
jgi:single-strand DNA-binding protein